MNGLNIDREDAVLVVIDFQEKMLPMIYEKEKLLDCTGRLIKGCRTLGVPILVTQQYTKGLGATVTEIAGALENFTPFEKTTFSAMKEPDFVEALKKTGKNTVLLTGVETHICVQQTALALIEAGYVVYGVLDCMSSRTNENKEYGQIRMTQSGVIVTGYESVLFDMLVDSKNEHFKTISNIVK